MKVRITTAGLEAISAKVSRAANFLSGSGMRAVLQQHGKMLVQEFRENIATFTPGPVPDIKPATKLQKQRGGFSVYPILVRTGDMVNSLYSNVIKKGRTSWRIALGFKGYNRSGSRNADVALAHLRGGPHLPQRDFTTITDKWRDSLFAAMKRRK